MLKSSDSILLCYSPQTVFNCVIVFSNPLTVFYKCDTCIYVQGIFHKVDNSTIMING